MVTTITGLVLDQTGQTRPIIVDREEMLHPMYAAIGCDMVECVPLEGMEMWVDEEGLLKRGQTVNPTASALYLLHRRGQTPIMGVVVFFGPTDDEGWSTSLDGKLMDSLIDLGAEPDPFRALMEAMAG